METPPDREPHDVRAGRGGRSCSCDLEPLSGLLQPDLPGTLVGVGDVDDRPPADEPAADQAEISAALR